MKGCAPHPTLLHKCQPPSTCSTGRIPVQAQKGWAYVAPVCLSSPKVTFSSSASRGVSIGKMPEVIYTSHSRQTRFHMYLHHSLMGLSLTYVML